MMEKQYFLNAHIIDPKNLIDEIGGLIIDENGKIEAVGKKVNKNNIPSREKYIDLKTEEEKLQALREKGFQMFVEDMNNGGYPESKHEIKMDSIEFEKFQEKIK